MSVEGIIFLKQGKDCADFVNILIGNGYVVTMNLIDKRNVRIMYCKDDDVKEADNNG